MLSAALGREEQSAGRRVGLDGVGRVGGSSRPAAPVAREPEKFGYFFVSEFPFLLISASNARSLDPDSVFFPPSLPPSRPSRRAAQGSRRSEDEDGTREQRSRHLRQDRVPNLPSRYALRQVQRRRNRGRSRGTKRRWTYFVRLGHVRGRFSLLSWFPQRSSSSSSAFSTSSSFSTRTRKSIPGRRTFEVAASSFVVSSSSNGRRRRRESRQRRSRVETRSQGNGEDPLSSQFDDRTRDVQPSRYDRQQSIFSIRRSSRSRIRRLLDLLQRQRQRRRWSLESQTFHFHFRFCLHLHHHRFRQSSSLRSRQEPLPSSLRPENQLLRLRP